MQLCVTGLNTMKKPNRLSFALIGLLILVGCTTAVLNPVQTSEELLSYPESGKEVTGNLGDTLLSISKKRTFLGIEVKVPVEMEGFTVVPQELKAAWQNNAGIPSLMPGVRAVPPVFGSITYEENKAQFCVFEQKMGFKYCSQALNDAIEIGQIEDENPLLFQRELVYNGRVGNQLKFIYREFDASMARTAFTQEAQYDLSESDIIGFKNARIRVIEANNRVITYEVLANFDPRAR